MGTVLIYDADYFHYPGVIPNLECAKLAAYEKKKRNVTVFNNLFEPERYTQTFYRKEYDDGTYDKRILMPTVEYGGRAFSEVYKPLPIEAEYIEPDFEIYRKFSNLYGARKVDTQQIKTLLTATHARLSLDGKTYLDFPYQRLRPRHPCVVLHDYDLAALPDSFDMIKDISDSRPRGLKYHIGNKYPIQTYDFESLKKWLTIYPMGNCFYLQYNGLLTDEQIIELVEEPSMSLRQLVYNFTYGCFDENDFVIRVLPEIYKQALFLRKNKLKILLNIDEEFFKTSELLNLMKLINCFYGKNNFDWLRPHERTLYSYCACRLVAYLDTLPWIRLTVSKQEMRDAFQYVRIHNYEVFDMFYSVPDVIAKGGKLVNEWEGRTRI